MRDYNRSASASEYPEPRLVNTGSSGGLGGVVTIANLLMAVVMAIALVRAQMSAIAVVITTGLYYASTTSLFLLITSGALTEIVRTRSDARTQRELHRLQLTLYSPPASPLPEPAPPVPALPQTSSFVPAYDIDRSDWLEAKTWLTQLFDLATGQPDPKKVLGPDTADPNRIRCKMPSKPVTQFLLDRRIIRKHNSGYALSPRYSLLRDALDAIDLTPVPTAPVGGYTLGGGVP